MPDAVAKAARELFPYIDRRLLLEPYGTDAYDRLARCLAFADAGQCTCSMRGEEPGWLHEGGCPLRDAPTETTTSDRRAG